MRDQLQDAMENVAKEINYWDQNLMQELMYVQRYAELPQENKELGGTRMTELVREAGLEELKLDFLWYIESGFFFSRKLLNISPWIH